jgi:hypothetical protein
VAVGRVTGDTNPRISNSHVPDAAGTAPVVTRFTVVASVVCVVMLPTAVGVPVGNYPIR